MGNTSFKTVDKADCSTGELNPVSSSGISRADVGKYAKFIYIIFGVIFFGLGVIGTVLPLLPTTPLIVLAAVCFGKSSHKLHTWCVSTKFYKNNVDSFVKKRSMTIKSKAILLLTITIVMGLSFVTMTVFSAPMVARIILIVIWLSHMVYFGIITKTTK